LYKTSFRESDTNEILPMFLKYYFFHQAFFPEGNHRLTQWETDLKLSSDVFCRNRVIMWRPAAHSRGRQSLLVQNRKKKMLCWSQWSFSKDLSARSTLWQLFTLQLW